MAELGVLQKMKWKNQAHVKFADLFTSETLFSFKRRKLNINKLELNKNVDGLRSDSYYYIFSFQDIFAPDLKWDMIHFFSMEEL